MQICAETQAVGTSQINVLANDTRSTASHCYRNRVPGGVPSAINRVVLPSLARLIKLGVEATDEVDFAIVGVIGRVNKRATLRHWSAGGPTLRCDIVDLRRILDAGVIKAAEYVDRVGIACVNRSRGVHSDWNTWQAGPSVTNWIVAVKPAGRAISGTSRSGIGVGAIAGHRRRFDHERIFGDNGPRRQGRAQPATKGTGFVGSPTAVRPLPGRASLGFLLRQRERNCANTDE
jgi:hypothetical protein